MDCKVPVMFTYLGIIIIFSTFGHAYAETTVFYIDSVIKNQLTKCGNDIIVRVREGDTMKLTFQSSPYVNLAFCNNESTKNLNAKLNISNGKTITFDIVGSEEYEGLWNCSFLTHIGHYYVRDSVPYEEKYYASYANCSLMVRIQRDVTLTVSSTTTTNLVTANATDIGYYRFIEGNKITIECKKGHTNGTFLQSENLIFKICRKDKSCADLKTNSTLVRDTMELNSTFDGSILHCIYNNSVGYQTDAEIVLQIKAQSRPEIAVGGLTIREPRSSESKHTFDGTVNQTLELVCANKENWGNIHWEVCYGSGVNCQSQTLAADKILKLNFTLSANNKNTTVKCVHTFNALRQETPVFLYANEPPVLTTKNDMILNYTRGTDTYEYVIEREDEETIRIKCKNQENSGSLSWRDCNNAAQKSCTKTQDIYNRSIEKVIPWNSEKIEVFFYCVYKNSRNYNVSSKVNIVVHPSMSTRFNAAEATTARFGQTPKETSKSSTSSPTKSPDVVTPPTSVSSATSSKATTTVSIPITTKQTQKATSNTTPSKSSTKTAPASGAPSKGQSSTILKIKKDGDEASGFTNGQTLCFSCYDTNIDAEKCIIKLITAGQDDVEVPVEKENEKINNRNSYSGCLEMNFTSTDVEVKCLIFREDNDEKPSTIKLLRLTRKNPDFEPEGNPDLSNTILAFLKAEWMWVALGGGVLMLLIVITATVRAFRKGKREEAMVQRASVNYESFTNEPQESTPPFPQGPKLEQTYLAPIDLQESPYATSRPENDTYALPYTPSNIEELYSKPVPKRSRINELYTKVLPKSLRKQQESSKYVNSAELTYAEISHTGPSKKPVAHKQIQKEDNYAAVVHNNYVNVNKDTKYGKARNDGYSEVVPNTTYANVTNDVYVEPSYCELGRHK